MILFEALFFLLVSLPALSDSGSKNIVTSENSVYNSTCWTQTIRTCKPLSDSKGHSVNLAGNTLSEPPALYEDCYPWMFRNETSGACECSDIPYRAVLCDPTIPLTYILDCYCMTYNSALNETELGRCLSGCGHKDDIVYYKLPQNKENLNSYSCSKVNRDSPLCEKYILPLDGQHYHIKHALYYDASVEYFQGDHLYYGISAIFIGIVMGILPLVFLVVYPMRWFQKCLNRLHIQRQSIDTLVNCYQGYYKDGTDGTRDYRIFSVVFFCVQITVMILYTFSKSIFTYPVAAMIILLYIFAILTVQPYKEQFKAYTTIDAYMLLTIAMVFIMTSAADDADIKAVEFSTPSYIALAAIEMAPTIYLVGLIVWWIFVKNRVNQKLPCFQIRKESYNTNDFPDRIEHPQSYQAENTPMINSGQENRHHNMYYGAAASP